MALINCPNCGKQISDKAANCIGCGIELAAIRKCEECGEIILPGVAACPNCGCPVENAAAETVKPAPAVLPTPEPVKQPEPVASVSKPVPEPATTAVQPIPKPVKQPEPVAAMPKPAATTVPQPAAPAVQQAAPATSKDGVIVKGDSGKKKVLLVLGIVFAVLTVIELASFIILIGMGEERSPMNIAWIFMSFTLARLFLSFSAGCKIEVTASAITGQVYGTKFKPMPISTITAVTRDEKNTILITSTNEKNKTATSKFKNIPNHEEIVNAINSLISSR